MVQMLPTDQARYPALRDFLRDDLFGRAHSNRNVWDAYKTWADLNDFTAFQAVNWGGSSPVVRIASLPGNGRFLTRTPNWIYLDDELALAFQTDWRLEKARLCIESTVLHELVHWGDNKDGHHKRPEAGKSFEHAAYDDDIDRWFSSVRPPSPSVADLLDATGVAPKNPRMRGIRNNNPGNIKIGEPWHGLAKPHEMTTEQRAERTFCVFVEPVWGIRAMLKILRTYHSRGKSTVHDVIATWAPASADGNQTLAYASFVAKRLGASNVHVDLDVLSREAARKVVEAMIAFENALVQPYGDDVINFALDKAGYG